MSLQRFIPRYFCVKYLRHTVEGVIRTMYLFFDSETGGLDPRSTSLLEIAAVIVDDDGHILSTFQRLTRPDDGVYRVTPGALNVNKIVLASHDTAAVTYTDAFH